MNLTYSDIKYIREFCEDQLSEPSWRDVVTAIADGETDFEVDNVRFIHSDDIDEIMADELAADEYLLGCFNSWFLADVLDIDIDVINAMQKAEAFEAIGKLIISMDKLTELASAYASADGYGHHFNPYDGSEAELLIGLGNNFYHAFDNH